VIVWVAVGIVLPFLPGCRAPASKAPIAETTGHLPTVKATLGTAEIDYGPLGQQLEMVGDIEYINDTAVTKTLAYVNTSCGCTSIISDIPMTMPPAASTKLAVRLRTGERIGQSLQTIWGFDENKDSFFVTEIKCDVVPDLIIEDDTKLMRVASRPQPIREYTRITAGLKNLGDLRWEVLGPLAGSVRATIPQKLAAHETSTVTIDLVKVPQSSDRQYDVLKIYTANRLLAELNLSVGGDTPRNGK